MTDPQNLSRRERQIMDIVYELGQATSAEILERLPDPPSAASVRTLLRILEERGHLRHTPDGPRYVYHPTVPRNRASRSALRHVLRTFFENRVTGVVETLLDIEGKNLSQEEVARLAELIEHIQETEEQEDDR
ncbi:MAG: BlaI/MecI/CopY family transcriptional regulator [Planctomycetota bacterium]